jgi:hypothetical protein
MVRKLRNKALVDSDPWMFVDRGLNTDKKNELKAYRQALRDYPETIDWTGEVAEIDSLDMPQPPEWMV